MKKIVVVLSAFFVLSASAALAAPVNDLAKGQTAIGAGSDTVYLEHRVTDGFTVGYQNVDRDAYGSRDDFYGQINLTDNVRGIVGTRDFAGGSKMYLGMAVNGPVSSEAQGYASMVAGSEFKEMQVVANVRLTHNVDLNLNYHSFMPDVGRNQNGVGVGATLKF